MEEVAIVIVQILGVIFLVDFFSGFFHWLEDSYGTEQTPLFGWLVVSPNLVHHRQPRDFVRNGFWERNLVTMLLSALIFAVVALLFSPSWQLWLFCGLGAFCNEFHCWAHRSPAENGPLITRLHQLQILQTPEHHSVHHTDPKNRAYCVLTNYANPLLDRIDFWRLAESFIIHVAGIHPRPDLSLKV